MKSIKSAHNQRKLDQSSQLTPSSENMLFPVIIIVSKLKSRPSMQIITENENSVHLETEEAFKPLTDTSASPLAPKIALIDGVTHY